MNKSILDELIKKQCELDGRKILHFGSLAGWPNTMARVSREMGLDSENWIHLNSDIKNLDRKLPFDKAIFSPEDNFIKKSIKRLNFIKNCHRHFCLVHYHGTNFFSSEKHFMFEGPYLKQKKIPMVLSLGGGEGRLRAFSRARNKYYYKNPDFLADLRIKLRWLSWRKNIAICASEPELALIAEQYFENVTTFMQPICCDEFPINIPNMENRKPLLLHVPTEPEVKGTKYIIEAVERLKAKKLDFEFKMAHQLTQKEFYKLLATCDVYIDELRCGGHGVTAVEAMAMGKPTISYIRDDLINRYPEGLPLVNANVDTIEPVLEKLILDSQARFSIGVSSRQYVEKNHDARKIICKLAPVYLNLLNACLN